jgi:hypothetical protein
VEKQEKTNARMEKDGVRPQKSLIPLRLLLLLLVVVVVGCCSSSPRSRSRSCSAFSSSSLYSRSSNQLGRVTG